MSSHRAAIVLAAAAVAATLTPIARAQETQWQNGNGDWHDPAHWSLGLPTSSGDASISGATATVSAGSAAAFALYVGKTANGQVTQSGGAVNTGELHLGFLPGKTGTWIQTGGTTQAVSWVVGESGNGYVHVSGGTLTGLFANVAESSGSSGTMEISGSGKIQFARIDPQYPAELRVGLYGTATLKQTGGTLDVDGWLQLGLRLNSQGTYNISGGTATIDMFHVGEVGKGTVNQTGGSVAAGTFAIGMYRPTAATPISNYNLSAGTFSADTAYVSLNAIGRFNQSGGNATFGELYLSDDSVGAGEGSYTLSGGNVTIGTLEIGRGGAASFYQTGGVSQIDKLLIHERGQYKQTGGALVIKKNLDVRGEFDFDGMPVTFELEENASAFLSGGVFEQAEGVTIVGASGSFITLPAGVRLGHEVKEITSDGIVHWAGQPLAIDSGKSIHGTGTIVADVTNNGLIAPGNSPGVLQIAGDFAQASDGELLIEIAGTDVTLFDRVLVDGNVALDGILRVELLDGFVPEANMMFEFLVADAITGAFANALDEVLVGDHDAFDVRYQSGRVQLTNYHAVPEPAAMTVLGLAAMATLSRRRRVQ